jgi:hypothetical protein
MTDRKLPFDQAAPVTNTMGIVLVAAFAANADGRSFAQITATLRIPPAISIGYGDELLDDEPAEAVTYKNDRRITRPPQCSVGHEPLEHRDGTRDARNTRWQKPSSVQRTDGIRRSLAHARCRIAPETETERAQPLSNVRRNAPISRYSHHRQAGPQRPCLDITPHPTAEWITRQRYFPGMTLHFT